MRTSEHLKIFCVVPAYNEEQTITRVVEELEKQVDQVVVVDDASNDRTFELASQTKAVVLHHVINRDQGAALQTGNEYALSEGAAIIIHFDADGQFSSQEINDMLEPILKGECEITFGSRFMGKKSNLPWRKEFLVFPLARLINRLLFGVCLSDPQCGFRAFSSSIAKDVSIEQDGKAHCNEIMEKVFAKNIAYKEVPVTIVYNRYGLKLTAGVKILKDLILAKILN